MEQMNDDDRGAYIMKAIKDYCDLHKLDVEEVESVHFKHLVYPNPNLPEWYEQFAKFLDTLIAKTAEGHSPGVLIVRADAGTL